LPGVPGQPLRGVTVVSLEQAVAAPLATRHLADLGARVIKVERPLVGDFARGYDEAVLGQASYFVWLNRSKESLALDLKDPRAIDLLHELLANADVFVENLAPGATARLGLSRATLAERYPRLVTCEITGFGAEGPWADRKAYDLLVQCETGLVAVTGEGDSLAKVAISVADIAAGMYAYSGILAALFERATTGVAPSVEVSLFDALSEWMSAHHLYTRYSGIEPARHGVDHATVVPYGLFRTAGGGAIVLAVQNEREWRSLCEHLLGDLALADDPRFSRNAARVEHREEVKALINARLALLDVEACEKALDRAGVAHGRVNTVAAAVEHPVLTERGRWREIETPAGAVAALLPPVRLGGGEPHLGPLESVGASSAQILAELGRSEAEIELLEAEGVISR
jgi:itaconate CoA-transferase